MRSDELLNELRQRFGEIASMRIDVVDIDDTSEEMRLKGTVVAETVDGKLICSMSIINMKCVFIAGIYSNLNVGAVVHKAILRNVPIYFMHVERDGMAFLSVPCEFNDIDLDRFEVVTERDKPCKYDKTMKCPLYRYQQKEEKTRTPMII